jgi:hypothetical protein
MGTFSIEPIHADYTAVYCDGVKVGIVFPARGDQALSLYPNPAVFPDLAFTGLPAPMRPEFMTFPDMDALRSFLGVSDEAVAA